MTDPLDKLADARTGNPSVTQQYHEAYLEPRPQREWAPTLDQTAEDLLWDVRILDLTRNDFPSKLAPYYKEGLEATVGSYTDLQSLLSAGVTDEAFGKIVFELHRLRHDIDRLDMAVSDVQHATEAVIEKVLSRAGVGSGDIRLDAATGGIADIAVSLFNSPDVAEQSDLVLDEFTSVGSAGLLGLMDTPQMMTDLWTHQREALLAWAEQGYRGYVDMATATGKTVIGLAAIALRFGELDPDDHQHFSAEDRWDGEAPARVLVVAHNDLILAQWRREFDYHLNIPEERTVGSDDVSLHWGDVAFRTAQRLVNEPVGQYDLVILDEAHHYANGAKWGSLLDRFEGDVLAMSGSVDQAGDVRTSLHDRLQSSVGPPLAEYTILDGQRDGIIPSFTWEILYAGYTEATDLRAATRGLEDEVAEFREDVDAGRVTLPSNYSTATFDELRRFARTNEASELRQQDPAFDALSRRLMARRTIRWNVGPQLWAVRDIIVGASDVTKAVVLTQSRTQVADIVQLLEDSSDIAVFELDADESKSDQLRQVATFDEAAAPAVIIGTGSLLGEGVDMRSANLAINLATGKVNPALVQLIGRVLRNPTGSTKHAHFINVVGVPSHPAETVPTEDGRHVLELAAEFCGLGARFNELPEFRTSADVDQMLLHELLTAGDASVKTLRAQDPALVDLVGLSEQYHDALRDRLGSDLRSTFDAWNEYAQTTSAQLRADAATPSTGPTTPDEPVVDQIKGAYQWLRETIR